MRRYVVCMAMLSLAACQEREPTGPDGRLRPQLTHGGPLHQGPGFRFISPTPPGSPPIEGTFNATLTPVVDICRLDTQNGTCVADVASLNAGVSLDPEQYQVSWTGLHDLPRAYYRIEVRSAPFSETHQLFGSVDVQLTAGGGTGLDVSGNTLPIKFWISTSATCTDDACAGFTAYNDRLTQVILEESDTEGSAGFRFEPGFCAKQASDTECLEYITVVATRYRGPERCIPDPGFEVPATSIAVPAIQYEVCVRVRTFPDGVSFNAGKVFAYLCADLRAAPLQNNGLLRFLKVTENAAGSGVGGEVTDLTGTAENPTFFFSCRDDIFTQAAPSGSAHATSDVRGRVTRFAALAGRVVSRAGRYLAPAPAHARRRAHFPIVASPIGFSRLGLVVPVAAEFSGEDITGYQNQLLPAALRPTVRVLAADPHGVRSTVPVPFVRVRFTVLAGGGSVANPDDSTDTDGYASARWTLGLAANNPQELQAQVGAPAPHAGVIPIFPNGEPTAAQWWASHTFTATAWQYAVHFLAPLGASGGGMTNVVFSTSAWPTVRVCGPLASTTACRTLGSAKLKNNAYEISWSTGKNGADGALYRIEVVLNGLVTGTFHAQRGGGGGGTTDPLGSPSNPYHFQDGSNIPIRFMVVVP